VLGQLALVLHLPGRCDQVAHANGRLHAFLGPEIHLDMELHTVGVGRGGDQCVHEGLDTDTDPVTICEWRDIRRVRVGDAGADRRTRHS
jgi:hypothetical protein